MVKKLFLANFFNARAAALKFVAGICLYELPAHPCHFACASEALPCRGSTLCVETADERSDATLRRAPLWETANQGYSPRGEISTTANTRH